MNNPRSFGSRGRLAFLLLAACLAGASPQAFGERADRDKAAVINSDGSDADNLNQTSVYTGNVELTKGTIILRADQLTVKEDPEGYNLATAIVTKPGTLVYFKQKREGLDEYIEGRAERVEYDEKADMIRLFNHAIVKRLVVGRPADESQGDQIFYDLRTEKYRVVSNNPTESTTNIRTKTILQPKVRPNADSATVQPQSQPNAPVQLKRETQIVAPPSSP